MTSNIPNANEKETQVQERIAELERANHELRVEILERARSEEASHKLVERYRTMFNSINEGLSLIEIILDDKGKPVDYRILEVNRSLEKITGFRDIVGKRVRELIPNVEDYWIENFGKVALTGDSIRLEEWSEDVKIWFEVYASRIGGKGSLKVAILFKDITERKQAEGALEEAYNVLEEKVKKRTAKLERSYNLLKESERSLAEAQKLAHIGSWDKNLITNEVHWSDEAYRIFGFEPQKFGVNYDLFLSRVHPDDQDHVIKGAKQALEKKLSGIDYRIVLDNGEERIVHEDVEAVFNEENIPVRLRGTIQDITEHKKVDEKLKDSEEKYRNIVETADEGIGIIDSEFKLTYVNKKLEDMLGYSTEEFIDKSIWDFLSEESKPIVNLILERGLKDFENPELKYIRKNGSYLWAHVNAKPIFDSNGKFMGITTMLSDITKRKEAEESLAKIETARKKEIHHRIKNNLQVISSLLDLQGEKFRGRKNIQDSEVLEAFRESQDRVISMALIHEELYKGEEFETLNFSLYIKELTENLFNTYRLENKDLTLNMDLEESLFFDMDTAVPLGIVVNELVSNSLKHAFPGRNKGEVLIKINREENEECIKSINKACKTANLTLTVSDNGIGIPESLDIENPDNLGLQLVTSLVHQLDGVLELKRNKGTEFIIKFTVTGETVR